MKAIRVHEVGGPEVLRWEDLPEPAPGPGELVFRVEAAGLNFIDVYRRSGLYEVELPNVPGGEAAGSVLAVGPDVRGFEVGDRVASAQVLGAYAEQARVRAQQAVKIPIELDAKAAAALMLQGMTAHYLVDSSFPLKSGHTCLIHAAAGGVGLLLVQLAKKRKARVFATVSNEEKAALAREAGADEVVLYTKEDFEKRIKSATNGRGVDVVYDSVGRSTFDKSLASLAPLGMLVLFGQSSGPVPPFDPQRLAARGSLFLTRPSLFHYIAEPESLARRAGDVLAWAAEGSLKAHIGATFPLAEAAEAHRALEGRRTTGKVLLLP